MAITTGNGDFAVNINSIPSGGVNLTTAGPGKSDIVVGNDTSPLAAGRVHISGSGRNSLTIDDAGDTAQQAIFITDKNVTFSGYTSVSFDENFLKALIFSFRTRTWPAWP